jgi:ferrous iron transport protein B
LYRQSPFRGADNLLKAIACAHPAAIERCYDRSTETAIQRVSTLLPQSPEKRRSTALRLLSGDPQLAEHLRLNGALTQIRDELAACCACPLRTAIMEQQMQAAQGLLAGTISTQDRARKSRQSLAAWTVHPIWGWPILLAVLFAVYKLVGELGAGTLVNFMQGTVFGQGINPFATRLINLLIPIPLVHDLFVGPYGLITMALSYGLALVLPIVATFFFAFSILEDTGYLPRLAVMLNRTFTVMGLNGKAVLPMVLGLGCDTMATLSTRILETRKERILTTLLLALGVPCSAQLGVVLGMLSGISAAGVLLWAVVVITTMLVVGFVAAHLLPGERSPFILELPPFRRPRLDNIFMKTLARVEWYLKEVLPLFIAGTLLLFVIDRLGILHLVEQLAVAHCRWHARPAGSGNRGISHRLSPPGLWGGRFVCDGACRTVEFNAGRRQPDCHHLVCPLCCECDDDHQRVWGSGGTGRLRHRFSSCVSRRRSGPMDPANLPSRCVERS